MPFLLSLLSQGFVNKLDEFIQWLNEAMETTENWTPPKAETDSLRLYLETHLVGTLGRSCCSLSVKDFSVRICLGPVLVLVGKRHYNELKP